MKKTIFLISATLLLSGLLSSCPVQTNNNAVNVKIDSELIKKLTDAENKGTSSPKPGDNQTTTPPANTSVSADRTTSSSKWPDQLYNSEVLSCISTGSGNPALSKDTLTNYCKCSISTLEEKSPDPAKITQVNIQEASTSCYYKYVAGSTTTPATPVSTGWPSSYFNQEVSTCIVSASYTYPYIASNVINSYCVCSMTSLQSKFPSYPADVQKITPADIQASSTECVQKLGLM